MFKYYDKMLTNWKPVYVLPSWRRWYDKKDGTYVHAIIFPLAGNLWDISLSRISLCDIEIPYIMQRNLDYFMRMSLWICVYNITWTEYLAWCVEVMCSIFHVRHRNNVVCNVT